MDLLPDEVLLQVLPFLPVPDLFKCRLVCKRLNELALEPSVWRYKCSSMDYWKCPVLRLAPCLRTLWVRLLDTSYCHSLYTTRCAVERLAIDIVSSSGAVHAAMLIKHQEKLGRLKLVFLRICVKLESADACLLVETLASTSGLKRMHIDDDGIGDVEDGLVPAMAITNCTFINTAEIVSTLKEFHCGYFPELEPLFGCILSRHAATLETVSYISVLMGGVVPLLTKLPNLRSLSCSLVTGLGTLVACTSLEQLTLEVFDDPSESTIQETATLLRGSPQLRDVQLYHNDEPSSLDVVTELLLALASSGQSSVEKLGLYSGRPASSTNDSPRLQPEVVLRVLPLLPALRELKLDWRSDDLLRGIVPKVAPNLQNLVLMVPTCPHSLLHTKVLVSNPSLHVLAINEHCSSCESCDMGCHQELRDTFLSERNAYFFSHPVNKCSAPEFHKKNTCIYIPPDE